jgi:type I restriction enzyme S subunit
MSLVLHEGARSVSLLEAADLLRGVSYKREEARAQPSPGLLPVLRANNIQDGRLVFDDLVYVPGHRVSQTQRLRHGDIIIAMSSGSRDIVGKAAFVTSNWEGSFGAFCGLLRPKRGTHPEFLFYFLQSPMWREEIERIATGTNINNLSRTSLASIDVPHPEAEAQMQLVQSLSTLDESERSCVSHVAAGRRVIQGLRRAILAAACSGRLTADWRDQNPDQPPVWNPQDEHGKRDSAKRSRAVAEFSSSDFPELPDTWVWAPLAAVSESVLGKMLDREKNRGEPRPYLRNVNVRWRSFDLTDVQDMRFEPGEEERYGLRGVTSSYARAENQGVQPCGGTSRPI